MQQSHSRLLQPVSKKQSDSRKLHVALLLLGALALLASLQFSDSVERFRNIAHLNNSQFRDLPARYIICSSLVPASLQLEFSDKLGSIYTGNDGMPNAPGGYAQCVAVEDGIIADVGMEKDLKSRWCKNHFGPDSPLHHPKTPRKGPRSYKAARLEKARAHREHQQHSDHRCDLRRLRPGQTLYPGFQDAHGHILDYGWSRSVADLVGADSTEEIIRRLESHVAAHPEFQATNSKPGNTIWLEGLGWDQTRWNPPVFPTAADLSASPMLRHIPIALRRVDVHALWLSEKALELVANGAHGFPVHPKDDHIIQGGLVLRDSAGKPTGVLIDNAMNLAYQVMPKWTDAQRRVFLSSAAQGLLRAGITSVGDAATDLDAANFYQIMDQTNQLPFRIYSMLACPSTERRCAHRIKQKPPTRKSRFALQAVKLFNDGALGSWGSAMWKDYSDKPGERGLLLIDENELKPLVSYWLDKGWQVCTHAIGDKANSLTLDAYESYLKTHHHVNDLRPRIEHAQLMRPTDIERFNAIGVIASMQPTHCTSDMNYVESRIGTKRASIGAYPWKSLLRQNTTLALGSDFPVELPNPLYGIYSAITRLDAKGSSPHGKDGWYPHERLTRREALKGFTLDTSFAQHEEEFSGTITKGKRADFTLLDRDILDQDKVTPLMLREARVDATFIDGSIVYDGVADAIDESRKLLRLATLAKNPARGLQHVLLYMANFGHAFELGMLAGFTSAVVLLAVLFCFTAGVSSGEAYEKLSALALNTQRPKTAWMNMGLWSSQVHLSDAEMDLPTACRDLAKLLYHQAGVTEGSSILDVGCGNGDSTILLHQMADPAVLHAVTSLQTQAEFAASRLEAISTRADTEVKIWAEDINNWLERAQEADAAYDFVLVLDCAYHFRSRTDFIRMASRRLRPSGVIAFVDLLSSWPPPDDESNTEGHVPPWPTRAPALMARLQHRLNCLLLSVPTGRFWSIPRYTDELIHAGGFDRGAIKINDITRDVFPGFARFLHHFGKGSESWRGGSAAMRFSLDQFADIVARWSKGGDQGIVRCCIVVAKKGADDEAKK